jgi:DEAD/DEAH box helicase domain-containing protein
VAALDLGLRKKFRGDPGHLLTTLMEEPVPGSGIRKTYLLLYDGVPGGTGYLKELMRDQRNLIEVFELAHRVLINCTCQKDPEKDGCYRCLLAYRGRHDQMNTSRQAAIQLLSMILDNKHLLKRTERLDAVRLNRLVESELESRFIEALRLTADGESPRSVTAQVVNGKQGFYLRTAQGNYLIEPQVELGLRQGVQIPSRADFVIYPERPLDGELPIAIFTDGYEFHADPHSNMRVGLDTAQRVAIARSGQYRVWSLVWDDVEEHSKAQEPDFEPTVLAPGQKLRALLSAVDASGLRDWETVPRLSSLGLLLLCLEKGRTWKWDVYAAAYLASLLENVRGSEGEVRRQRDGLLEFEASRPWPSDLAPIADGARPWIVGRLTHKNSKDVVLVRGVIGIEEDAVKAKKLNRFIATFRLDDVEAEKDLIAWKRAWREFLRLMNLLQFARPLEFVSALGLRDHAYGSLLDEGSVPLESIPDNLAPLLELVDSRLRPLIRRIAERNGRLPEPGFELTSELGEILATAELAWPDLRVAVLLDAEETFRTEFERRGWKVFSAEQVTVDMTILVSALEGSA